MLVLLLGLALLLTRVVGTHLHFCLDGQEAPVAVHIADGEIHHDGHQGDDVEIDDASAAKSWQQSLTASFLFVAIVLLWLPAAPRSILPRAVVAILPQRRLPHVLRPPLRGPPLTASLA